MDKQPKSRISHVLIVIASALFFQMLIIDICFGSDSKIVHDKEAFERLSEQVASEVAIAYQASRFSSLSKDYFCRFTRDPNAVINEHDVLIDNHWNIVYSAAAEPPTGLMAGYLADFLNTRMKVGLSVKTTAPENLNRTIQAIVLNETGGGDANVPCSFTIAIQARRIEIRGRDVQGLRDGIVKLVDRIGFRQAPILTVSEQVFKPRIGLRLGVLPWKGSFRDLVFAGYNGVILTADKNPLTFGKVYGDQLSLYTLSQSDAIPELKNRQDPAALEKLVKAAKEARRHGLKVYCLFNTLERFAKDDPVFQAHPDILGTLTWRKDGNYSLCSEHPLVIQFLTESVRGVFEAIDDLQGAAIIVGAESFYHCYTFPYGAEPGHTTCPRCEKLGAETVVSNLCHRLLDAARQANPNAQIFAWPYQAYPWSADVNQEAFIKRLKPGMGILTEAVNREVIEKPEGVKKIIEDYSIDPIGPGKRAVAQINACRSQGIPIHIKSEPELSFEAPALPQVPCPDRRADRAEALAESGIDGVWLFPYFKACYGTSAMEVHKFFWWEPAPDKEQLLQQFAARIAGEKAGPHLRRAWKEVSEAVTWSPEICLPHYVGPYYLGPAHPMCADPNAVLPPVFYGNFLFHVEIGIPETLKLKPVFLTAPTGDIAVFGRFYKRMAEHLARAVNEIQTADPFVAQRHRLTFDAEAMPIRWFYHTARTQANFYESCRLRDQLLALAKNESRTAEDIRQAKPLYDRWLLVLADEKENAAQSIAVVSEDVRLDFSLDDTLYFPHAVDMIQAKLKLIDYEITVFLPECARKIGIL